MRITRAAFPALFVWLLHSCSGPEERGWCLHEIITPHPVFNSSRLVLAPEQPTHPIEVEIVKTRSGLRMYVNVLVLEAPPHEDNPKRTSLDITFEDGEKITVYPYLLQGGQKLLLPEEITGHLIERLQRGETFILSLGPKKTTVVLHQFSECYKKLESP